MLRNICSWFDDSSLSFKGRMRMATQIPSGVEDPPPPDEEYEDDDDDEEVSICVLKFVFDFF
jgi:hypothetical protein